MQFWEHLEQITIDNRVPAFVGIWPRGGAKSSSVEMGIVRLGRRRARKYVWYCCETQEQADGHVSSIGAMLETRELEVDDPFLAQRKVGKYGRSRGWRRNRLSTASGLVVDAIGLDTARRGVKIEQNRPDLIVFDDIDNESDSAEVVKKKIKTLTTAILPAGAENLAVIFVQNLIYSGSIASQLSNGKAEFLRNRIVSGPFPAVEGLAYEFDEQAEQYRITAGEATWEGQSIAICEGQLTDWGPSAFLREAQHEVDEQLGGIWDKVVFRHIDKAPEIIKGCVWVDPAVTNKPTSNSQGIQADGLGVDGKLYRFYSFEGIMSPEDALGKAIRVAIDLGFETLGVETDQGGDLWITVYKTVAAGIQKDMPHVRMPTFVSRKAGEGHGSKVHRNQLMLTDYELGRVVHVRGTHTIIEKSLRRFPIAPLDLADVAYWGWWWLMGRKKGWSKGMAG